MTMRRSYIGVLVALLLPPWRASADVPAPVGSPGPAAIWASACTYCHDHGVAAPVFGRNLRPTAIAAIVRNGLGSMPAFHPSEINDEDLKRLADWVARHPASVPSVPSAPVR